MKKLPLSVLLLVLIMSASCTRDDFDAAINPLMLGTWKLDKTIEEDYHPINTLLDTYEEMGLPGDSITFHANNTCTGYMDGEDPQTDEYKMLNDSTIRIEFETYVIRELTETTLYLHQEDIDNALNEKYVYRVYMKR